MNFRVFIKKRLPDGSFTKEICIHDGFSGIKEHTLIDPTLSMSNSAAGSFECTLHRGSAIYNTNAPDGKPWIERAKTRIIIKRHSNAYSEGNVFWTGRVLTSELDFYNQEHIYAEGALSFLNDSIQEKFTVKKGEEGYTPIQLLTRILNHHNSKCPDKIIKVRSVSDSPTGWPEGLTEINIDNETTMSALSKLISTFGGNVRVNYNSHDSIVDPDGAVIEWWNTNASYPNQERPNAKIVFSKNLLDITQKRDATNLVTAIFPRGYKAYSGGNDAIGDDMFEPTDGSDVSPITWTKGAYIWRPKYDEEHDVRTCAYEYVSDAQGYHQTAATGFEDREGGLNPDKSLEVKTGEVYYISLVQSDNRSCYVITVNKLGRNPAILLAYKDAANTYFPYSERNGSVEYPTTLYYQKVEIPEKPEELADRPMYLNISCRGDFGEDSSYSGKGNMGIWKGRKIPEDCDEYITLKGLGDGSYSKYFYSDPDTNTTVVVDAPDQQDKDRTILYPKNNDKGSVATIGERPSVANENDVYYIEDENSRYAWISGSWVKLEVTNPDDLMNIAFGSNGTAFYVTSLDQWWIRVVNGVSVTYCPQKEFVRNGYTISMKELTEDYGWIEKISDNETVIDPDTLEELALIELYSSYFETLELTIKAIDMVFLEGTGYILNILDPVDVTSVYHGIAGTFHIQELSIPLANISETEVSIGYQTTARITRS